MPKPGAQMTGVGSLLNTVNDIKERWFTTTTYIVATNIEYGIYVEFGTYKMAAQPYLRPAADHARRNIDRWAANADSIDELVRDVALEIERYAKEVVPVDEGTLRGSIRAEEADGSVAVSTSIGDGPLPA
ncbi:hypothetical protein [Halocatena marina]|uniref:hypothetical protein n=1 Tax=Halocatena marina TaxID=2934937 RepID=UPI00200BA255|nr:hypothetical protein [Halocatena marina]